MNNPPVVKVGDRIRFTIEDTVTRVDGDGEIYPDYYESFYPDRDRVISVEVVKPPVKVGDKGLLGCLGLPPHSVAKSTLTGIYVFGLENGKFAHAAGGTPWPVSTFGDEYEVMYVPEGAK